MLTAEYRLGKKVPASVIILAVVLLAGVLSTAYGFYEDNHIMLYAGLAIILVGALNGIVFRTLFLKS